MDPIVFFRCMFGLLFLAAGGALIYKGWWVANPDDWSLLLPGLICAGVGALLWGIFKLFVELLGN